MKLTEFQWSQVFEARCDSKLGKRLTHAQWALLDAAYKENQKRYSEMGPDVFKATAPFGWFGRHG